MSQRIIAIGDIHGCSAALKGLIDQIALTEDDLLVPLGDYIDRGPDSRGVIDLLISLGRDFRVVPLLGNHELMLLDSLVTQDTGFWSTCGGEETLESYGGSLENVPQQHLDFFYDLRRFFETGEHVFVHANYEPNLPWDQQPDQLLFWTHLSVSLPRRHQDGKTVIVGHTPQVFGEVLDHGHIKCIDTFCVGGGYLTALDALSGRVWQVDRAGNPRRQQAGSPAIASRGCSPRRMRRVIHHEGPREPRRTARVFRRCDGHLASAERTGACNL